MLRLGLFQLSLSLGEVQRRLALLTNFRPSGASSLTTSDNKIFRARDE
jgi:hypothetical protein